MSTWKIEAVTGRMDDGVVTEVHWRYGSAYGSVPVSGDKDSDFLALAKAALGADRVAEIEASEALNKALSEAPDVVTVAPAQFAAAVAVKPSKGKKDAVIAAKAAVDSLRAAKGEPKVSDDVA